MAAFDPPTSQPPTQDPDPTRARRARYGRVLFAVYLILYGGFVLLNAFSPNTMEWTPFAGVNLAVWSGLGLIAFAFVLAVVYDLLCRWFAAVHAPPRPKEPEGGQ